MRPKNYHLYSNDPAQLNRWEEEYKFIGRHVRRTKDGIVILALPPQKPVKKKVERRGKTEESSPKPKWSKND